MLHRYDLEFNSWLDQFNNPILSIRRVKSRERLNGNSDIILNTEFGKYARENNGLSLFTLQFVGRNPKKFSFPIYLLLLVRLIVFFLEYLQQANKS